MTIKLKSGHDARGVWVSVKVDDPETWERIRRGEFTGVSWSMFGPSLLAARPWWRRMFDWLRKVWRRMRRGA